MPNPYRTTLTTGISATSARGTHKHAEYANADSAQPLEQRMCLCVCVTLITESHSFSRLHIIM